MKPKKILRAVSALSLAMALSIPTNIPVFANTVGTEITSETTALSEGSYYLNHDVALNSSLALSSGDVSIDLNGHKLSLAQNAGQWKSVIYVSGGNLTVDGDDGSISGGTGGYNQRGGGFHVDGGNVTVNNVNITENNAAWGGGVFINSGDGTFTMNDSHITNNTSISDGNGWNDGGGVYLDGGTFTINGGSITNNKVTGGKKNGALVANDSTFNISGDVIIYDNKDGDQQENLFADAIFSGSGCVNVIGPLGPNAKIGVTSRLNQVFTSSENTEYNDPTKFVSDSSSYKPDRNKDGQLMLVDAKSILCDSDGFTGTYDGEEHGINVEVTDPVEGATIKYGLSADTCTLDKSPTFKDVTESPVNVYYHITAYNHNDKTGFETVAINKADSSFTEKPSSKDLTYNGSEQALVTEGSANGGEIQYAIGEDEESIDGWSTSVPTAKSPDTYSIWYKIVGDKNHNDSEPEVISSEIKKSDSVVSVQPQSKELTGNGSEQELIDSGSSNDGKIQYALGKNDKDVPSEGWSTSIPVASKPGTYYVWYKVIGDENHNDSEPEVISSEIKKSDSVVSVQPQSKELTENGSEQKLIDSGSSNDGKIQYALGKNDKDVPSEGWSTSIPVASKPGTYYVWYKVIGDENHNDSEPKVITCEIAKKDSVSLRPGSQIINKTMSSKATQTKSKITLTWKRVPNASVYKIYGSYCGKKMKLQKTVNGNATKLTLKKLNGKKINLKRNFKFQIYAYKKDGNKLVQIANSLDMHIAGRKNAKYTNVKSVKVSKKSYSLKKNRTAKIKAKLVLVKKNKKVLDHEHGNRFRYLSSNSSVATVNSKGIIHAKKAGKCTITVYAINGCEKKLTVNVK